MSVRFGSARIDENGNISGGKAGDQTGREVCQENGYIHNQGWVILRSKNAKHAAALANAMVTACNNDNIGYSQGDRYGVVKNGVKSSVKTSADCASLVRACIKAACGIDTGDFYTGTEKSVVLKTGLFDEVKFTTLSALYTGDILVTKTKGHTVIVTSGKSRAVEPETPETSPDAMVYAFNGTAAQQMQIRDNGDGTVSIVNKPTGKVLEVRHGQKETLKNGRELIFYEDKGQLYSKWKMVSCDDLLGYYRFELAANNNYCVDVNQGEYDRPSYVQLYKVQEKLEYQYAQAWQLIETWQSAVAIMNAKSLRVLDTNPTHKVI